MINYIREVFTRKDLLIYLTKSGLKAEHKNSFLGYFWWLLDPLLGALIYYFLVVIVLGRGGENFAVYLVIGQVAWKWASTAVGQASRAILQYSSIIQQVSLPKIIFPLTKTVAQLFNFLFGLIVIAIFLVIFKVVPEWYVVFLPFVILVQLLFLMAIGLAVSYVSVFIRDVSNFLGHFMRLWFYASPVIWEGSRLPEGYKWIETFNPMAYILNGYRDVLMYGQMPNIGVLSSIGALSLGAVFSLVLFYNRNEHKIIKAL
ncbi:ABC transporter permease [Paenibacillus senegalensis]|uniref:ABC transporter permease n=1 Tax=Paenibacillus senegalensis TaxID=1465766 RepID=UPI0002896B14|nr:ABC transporter permease [Paenibacillus senegalensis]